MKRARAKNGFTLIEALVVTTIIAILIAIGFTTFKTQLVKGRDARRKADIVQLEKGLQMYWSKNGQFPSEACSDFSIGADNCGCGACGTAPGSCTGTNWCQTSAIWQGIVGQGFMSALPKDPINNTTYYYYYEPCCNQDCGGGRDCINKGCCQYDIGANRLETTGSSFVKTGRLE